MSNRSITKVDIAISEPESSFQIDGQVIEVLHGSGFAILATNSADDLTISRGTDGIQFEEPQVGDRVNCQVAIEGGRVLHGHQETQSMLDSVDKDHRSDAHPLPPPKRPDTFTAEQRLTKEEFIDEHCRRWGVAWADIANCRVAVPSDDGAGWKMVNSGGRDDEETLHPPWSPHRSELLRLQKS